MGLRKIFIAVVVFLFTSPVFGQQVNTAKLDSLFDALSKNGKVMGSVAIAKDGQQVYSNAIGYSNDGKEGKVPATVQTRYRIASVTKIFTAVMIFQLIEENKIGLTTTLDEYFPQIPNAHTITVGEMLNHRSGLQNLINDTSFRIPPKTEAQILDMYVNSMPDFAPGSKANYSNTNFVLLGYIIERITGKSYAAALKERIASKLGLENTYVGGKTDLDKNESYSYQYYNGDWHRAPETGMDILGGAGAIISTPGDLIKFIQALFAGKLVNDTSLEKMKTITDGMGMGLDEIPFFYSKGYGHKGDVDGFSSVVAYFPEERLAIAYCTNGAVVTRNDVLKGILKICFNREFAIPSFKTVAITTEELDKYLGVYYNARTELRITISKDNTTLIAQAAKQQAFSLKATGPDQFTSDFAGIELDFDTAAREMVLKQTGHTFVFEKQ